MAETIQQVKEQLSNAREAAKRIKHEAAIVAQRGIDSALTYAGGAVGGFIRGKWGEGSDRHVHIPGTEIELDTALAALGSTMAVLGWFGDASDEVGAVANGLGAYALGRSIEEKTASAPKK
jgi:hypothetical protein